MNAVATQPHVTLSGDIVGEYIVKDKLPSGELTLVPDTSIAAVRQRLGTEPMNAKEFEQHFGDLPTDDREINPTLHPELRHSPLSPLQTDNPKPRITR